MAELFFKRVVVASLIAVVAIWFPGVSIAQSVNLKGILISGKMAPVPGKGKDPKMDEDLKKAEYYYDHFAFYKAIPYYEKIADKMNDPAVYGKLGDCYRFTHNLQKAAYWYAKAVKLRDCDDEVVLSYAQVLMGLGKYGNAEKWLKRYQDNHVTDTRIANMIAGCNQAAAILNAAPSGTAILARFNTDGSAFAPTLWNNNLVFTSDEVINLRKKKDSWSGNSFYNIYSIECDAKGRCGDEYRVVTKTKSINIEHHDGPCTFTADGKQMYFTRNRYGNNKPIADRNHTVLLEIMIGSDYDENKKKFKNITPFQYNSKDYSVFHPAISPKGKMLVFASGKPGGTGGSDLYICQRTTEGTWSDPENVGDMINTEGEEVFPYWADEKTLYFSSDGHIGLGGLDIYKTVYDDKHRTFSKPVNMGVPLNSSNDDISLALHPDGSSSWFSSNRPAAKGGDNVYFYKSKSDIVPTTKIDSSGIECCRLHVDSVRITCLGKDANGAQIYHVTFNYENDGESGMGYFGKHTTDGSGNPVQNTSNPYLTVFPLVPSGGTISGVTPAPGTSIPPGTTLVVGFDFVPNSNFTKISIDGTSIDGTTALDCTDQLSLIFPNCTCGFCDDLYKDFDAGEATVTDSSRTIHIAATTGASGIIIKSFKAEIIGYQQTAADGTEACIPCDKNSDDFGNFRTGTLSTAAWGTRSGQFTPIFGGGFARHTLNWPPNGTLSSFDGVSMGLDISVPPLSTISCCDDIIQLCIRYSFTDQDCRTCSFIKCYTINRKH